SQANSYLRQAAQKPYYWVERDAEDGFLMSIEISDLEHFRTGADSLSLEAMLLAREWQTETSLEQLINLYKIASHLLGSRSLIEQLVGFRIEGQANQIIRNILHRSQPDPELLFDFQKQLEILVARDRTVDFTSEKLVIYDCIQRIFTDDDNGNGHMPKKMAKKHGVPWVKADRQETFKLTDRLYEYYNRLGEKTPAQLHRENKDTPESLEELANGNSLLLMLRPAMFKIYQISYRTEMEIRASITIIALLRYKANNGKYPSTLKKLVSAGYLNELPMDPFSDSPLVYKCQEDDFILYSFGYDFNDDGGIDSKWGTSEQGGDQVFWPIK
ncbi:MAG: hypothetical protein ACYST9_05710, partial [Planctomycetota bacterium]